MSSNRVWTVPSCAVFVLAGIAAAQCPDWSPQFAGDGFNLKPSVLASLDAGAGTLLYAGGQFTTAGSASAAHVALWDGSHWRALGDGLDDAVFDLAAFDDGSGPALYACGDFLNSGANPAPRVARWNGSSWSGVGSDLGATANAMRVFDDGSGAKLYVGIKFLVGPNHFSRVVRLDGATWAPIGADIPADVEKLAVHDDGSGAALYAAIGVDVLELVGGSWVQVGSPFTGRVFDLLSYDSGGGAMRLAAVGNFTLDNTRGVATWDGSTWTGIGYPSSIGGQLFSIVSWNGTLHVAGTLADGVAEYTGGGWVQTAFAFSDTLARPLATHDDGSGHGEELYVGGEFHTIANTRAQRVARFDGTSWRRVDEAQHAIGVDVSPNNGTQTPVRALVRWRDPVAGRDRIVAGGGFDWTEDTPTAGTVVAWDGIQWSSLGAGLSGDVTALRTYIDEASGQSYLLAIGKLPVSRIQRFDGTAWAPLGSAATSAFDVAAARYPGSNGDTLFSIELARIRRFDGNDWQLVGTATGGGNTFGGAVLYDDPGADPPYLYVAGKFSSVDGVSAVDIARWDGTSWSAVPGAPTDSSTFAHRPVVAKDASGNDQLVLTIDDPPHTHVWSFDGATWTDWGALTSQVAYTSRDWLVEDDGSGPAIYLPTGYRWRFGTVDAYIAPPPDSAPDFAIERNAAGAARALFFAVPESFDAHAGRGVIRWTDACAALTSYCTAKVNSLGCTPAVGWNGEPSIALSGATPFAVTASNVLNNKSGILFYGVFGRAAVPFQGGKNCVHSPVHRTPLRSSGGNVGVDDCSGVYSIDFTPWITGANDPLLDVGVTVDAQWWSRDPAIASTTGLTDAIEFEIRP